MVVIRQEREHTGKPAGVGRLLILTAMVTSYLLVGMVLFYHIERPTELEKHRKRIPLRDIIDKFATSNPSVNKTALNNLLTDVLRLGSTGKIQWKGADPPHWTYPRAIYFAVSIITTIGFGNVILKTSTGRLCAVLYAVVGIPLSVLLYMHIGRFFNEQLCAIVQKIHIKFNPKHEKLSKKSVAIIETLVVFVVGAISFVFLPSLAIHILEDGWSYLEACYFAFTTIATIGFGDYVAGADEIMPPKQMHWYRAGLTMWIFVGLGWLSTLLNAIGGMTRSWMDKGEEMASHEYDRLTQEDHHEHCQRCRHKGQNKRKHHHKKRKRKQSTPELEESRGYATISE